MLRASFKTKTKNFLFVIKLVDSMSGLGCKSSSIPKGLFEKVGFPCQSIRWVPSTYNDQISLTKLRKTSLRSHLTLNL